MSVLPLELLEEILVSHLDLQSLRNFSQTSTLAASLVINMPAVSNIVQHASAALQLMVESDMVSYFTARELFRTLTSKACQFCPEDRPYLKQGHLGNLLYLPTCERMRSFCAIAFHPPKRDLVCVEAAIDHFELPASLIRERQIPVFKTFTAGDMADRCPSNRILRHICHLISVNETVRLSLVEMSQIESLAREIHGPEMKRIWEKKGNPEFSCRLYHMKNETPEYHDADDDVPDDIAEDDDLDEDNVTPEKVRM